MHFCKHNLKRLNLIYTHLPNCTGTCLEHTRNNDCSFQQCLYNIHCHSCHYVQCHICFYVQCHFTARFFPTNCSLISFYSTKCPIVTALWFRSSRKSHKSIPQICTNIKFTKTILRSFPGDHCHWQCSFR